MAHKILIVDHEAMMFFGIEKQLIFIIQGETSYWRNIALVFYSNMGGAPNGEDFNCRR